MKEKFTHVYFVLEQSQDTKEYSYSRGVPTGRTFIRLLLILQAEHTRFKRGTLRKKLTFLVLLHRIR